MPYILHTMRTRSSMLAMYADNPTRYPLFNTGLFYRPGLFRSASSFCVDRYRVLMATGMYHVS